MEELPATPGELSGTQVACLLAIVRPGLAWVPERDLDAATFAALAEAGYTCSWAGPSGGPFGTLTPWGAKAIGVAIHEHQELHTSPDGERVWVDVPRWADARSDPPQVVCRREFGLVDLLADLAAGVAEAPLDPDPGLCVDTWTGSPVVLWGRMVPIDRRLKPSPGAPRGRKVKPPIDLGNRSRALGYMVEAPQRRGAPVCR